MYTLCQTCFNSRRLSGCRELFVQGKMVAGYWHSVLCVDLGYCGLSFPVTSLPLLLLFTRLAAFL